MRKTRVVGSVRYRLGRGWFSWVALVVVSGSLGACGDSAAPSGETNVGRSRAALTKGAAGARVGDSNYCDDPANKCALGEGDCDSSDQCRPGLVCVPGNLAKRGALTGDACAPATCGNGIKDAD